MSNVINGLTNTVTGITSSNLWSNLIDLLPYLIIIFSITFGINAWKKAKDEYGMIK